MNTAVQETQNHGELQGRRNGHAVQRRVEDAAASAERLPTLVPPVDIVESDTSWVVVADMPGLTSESVEIELDRERLTLAGTSRVEGLPPVRYERSFRVMRGLDADAIKAEYRDGVLTVTLPRPASEAPRRIQVT